jgi:hypothetical protein
LAESSPAFFTKDIIFKPRTGKTQGMRFKIIPPRKANPRIAKKLSASALKYGFSSSITFKTISL